MVSSQTFIISLVLVAAICLLVGYFMDKSNDEPRLPRDEKLRCFARLLGEPKDASAYIETEHAVWYQQGVYEGLVEKIEREGKFYYCLTESGRMWCAYPVKSGKGK